MGANDAKEQLEVCKDEYAKLEQETIRLREGTKVEPTSNRELAEFLIRPYVLAANKSDPLRLAEILAQLAVADALERLSEQQRREG